MSRNIGTISANTHHPTTTMNTILSLEAMATRFELVLHGDDPARLRAAGEEALAEIAALDAQLSFYNPSSEISWINANAARGPVKAEPRLFELLSLALDISRATEGAFDITVAPLMRAWGFAGGEGHIPDRERIESALKICGMDHIRMDSNSRSIEFDAAGVQLDLGGIGKGYAIDRAVEVLRECGVFSALIHGGTSTVHGIGTPPDEGAWRVAANLGQNSPRVYALRDTALSVSAVHGKSFTDAGEQYGHVIDPRTGAAVKHDIIAAVSGPSPTVCDALSTALLVLGEESVPALESRFPACTFSWGRLENS